MTLDAIQIQNLLYLVGAVAVATLWISALYLLRHRKPRSMEAGIESFSRELRALAPDRRPPNAQDHRGGSSRDQSNRPSGQPPAQRRGPTRDADET
jgi:hypothetical protein